MRLTKLGVIPVRQTTIVDDRGGVLHVLLGTDAFRSVRQNASI
jgi:hypothetical protein